jgi:hypothetical protein
MIKVSECPVARSDLLVEVVEDQIVIVDRQSSQVCELNPTASLIWPRLNGTSDRDTLVDDVCQNFEVDVDTARHDVEVFLSELMQLGFIV